MKFKVLLSTLLGICLIFSLCSCTGSSKGSSESRKMQDIEVTTKVGISASELGMKLPSSVNVDMKYLDANNSKSS